MWNAGVTPQSIIRLLGPWGRDLVGKYVRGRFSGKEVSYSQGFVSTWRVSVLFASGTLLGFVNAMDGC